ncbi:hypothetical protein CAPTEDRAFT_123234 [Capitella teleta]|uniref:Sulfotransferase domain-containing protein n=1 Tax=Capitella teleta TaxID=283909 RepID=R7TA41_CAPTE|nr:hypothetical protein CAPTEDRAFT_101353 [Capitella teleta]ELU10655.1 hypothetical protein CAPTEDRAFT_123234 [Capitella teleta]|eukprot:ELT90618.1 hypothetical protein CAPTEDRAFT_101353 [Capitella teleta]
MKEWKVKPLDVMIATPPKSGTTWMGEIVRQMRAYHPEAVGKDVSFIIPYVEMNIPTPDMPTALECQDKMLSPRIIKTHLPYEYTKEKVEQEGLKVIAVLREPKDTLTSYYHHYCNNFFNFPGDFHDFFELVRQDRLHGGNIFKMARDWWQARDLPNVLVVKYEEMKKDTAEVVRRVAEFLEIPLDSKTVESIVDNCNIDKMRKTALEVIPDDQQLNKVAAKQFFRKGVVGDWKNHFAKDEEDFVDECVREYFDPVGLHFNV